MVVNELLKIGIDFIKDLEYVNPLLEVRLLLSKLLDVDISYIYTYGEKEVSEEIQEQFLNLVKKRATGYPMAYILKEKEFMGLNFYIEEGVLIPRPDTETLVRYIIDYINDNYKKENINVLDIGIGSGAISLSIGQYCPNTRVFGVDIGYIPIKVSNINRDRLDVSNVSFHQGDLFKAIEGLNLEGKLQIIVSNPPYIPKEEIEKLQRDVRDFEPRLALDGGMDGLDFYRRITRESKDYLVYGGLLIYEIGHDQGPEIVKILSKEGFANIEIIKDIQGLDRVVLGFNKGVVY